jgi:uncharacterized MnhB-related membrane protein
LIVSLVSRSLRAFHPFRAIAFETLISRTVELACRAGAIASRVRVLSIPILGVVIQETIAAAVACSSTLGPLNVIPSAVLKFAPVAICVATIGVAISTCINVVTLRADKTSTAAINYRAASAAAGDAGRVTGAVGEAFGVGPIVAA